MSGAEDVRGDWSVATRAAVAELRVQLRRIADLADGMRLEGYRRYHAETCRTATPLASALAEHMGIDLDAIAWRLEPRGRTPTWLVGREAGDPARASKPEREPSPSLGFALDHFLFGGVVEQSRAGGEVAFGMRISPAGLEAGAQVDGLRLHTRGDVAELELPATLPEQAMAALVGRPLESLVAHPALAGRGYVIEEIGRLAIGKRSRTAVTIRAERVAWTPPWARDGGR